MWIRLGAVVGLFLSLLAAEALGTFTVFDRWVQANRFSIAKAPVDSNIVVVALDSRSLAAVGQWPWSRSVHANIIDKLVAGRANQIALDVDFSSTSTPEADEAFRKALEAAGGSTILAGFKQADGKELVDTVPLAKFADHAWIASVSVKADSDGRIRSVPFREILAGQSTPSLASYLAQVNNPDQAEINVDFAISSSSFPVISAIDLLEGRVPASQIAGKDVVVGATAVELRDLFAIPTGEIVPGSVLQALAAETAKNNRSILAPPLPIRALGICIMALLGLAVAKRSWTSQLAAFGTALVAVEVSAFVLQWAQHISLPTTSWITALVGLAVASTLAELDFRKLKIGSIQTRLGATKALLQEVIADSPAGVIVIDDRNHIRVANLAARKILQAGKTDWIGMLATDALPPALAQLFDTSMFPPLPLVTEPRHGQLSLQLSETEKVFEYSLTRSKVANEGDGVSSARCLTFQDVTERQEHIQRLSYLALHDSKTNSRNRNSFIQDLERLAARGERVTVVHLGIDRFKYINEDFGHEVGDKLLRDVSTRAGALLAEGRSIYRIAGDEFACILAADANAVAADKLAQSLLALSGAAQLGPYEVPFSLSIGLATVKTKGWTSEEVVRKSGLALAAAKAAGGKRISIFDAQMDEAATRRKELESALLGAVGRGEFHMLYQPQFDLASGRCIGVESLLRWTHPVLGTVTPGEFVPIAEQIGVIEEIGAWTLRVACRDIAGVSDEVAVAVNVSPRQFLRGSLGDSVAAALAASGLVSQRLEIEVTESVLVENAAAIVEKLKHLRSSGVSVALDDFGTGYSSLSYLLNLPIDKIKIDRSFVVGLPDDRKASAVLASILGVAKSLGFTALAEGIETEEQRLAVKQAGCQLGQGFLLAKPMTIDALEVYLRILGLGRGAESERGDQIQKVFA